MSTRELSRRERMTLGRRAGLASAAFAVGWRSRTVRSYQAYGYSVFRGKLAATQEGVA